ncbi:heavy-metal-associated domain-containing protein, partial [endosymbiont of Lamellibrachia barhami]|uniref:heavy-metal-associated domain-containing protein n=1 Tax=endosymbiont of Lamellibrachia barhami TaxID=205975 RepID=UPI0015AA0812
MTCPHCVNHVTKALQGIGGVETVEVTLDSGEAVITGSAAVDLLIAAVKDAGYSAESA